MKSRSVGSRIPFCVITPRALALSLVFPAIVFSTLPAQAQVSGAAGTQQDPAQLQQAQSLIAQAFTIAESTPAYANSTARVAAVHGAASLIPALSEPQRSALRDRWIQLALSSSIPRQIRATAFSAFFDMASRRDIEWARNSAVNLTDPAARAGAFIDLSETVERADWQRANDFAVQAQRAARLERSLPYRARALTYVALRMSTLNPVTRNAAVVEASSQAKLLPRGTERDYLLAETVGAAAKFDLSLARQVSQDIGDTELKNLALARINMSEVSQTTLTASTSDRIAALAKAAARYDVRAIPVLIQLPPQTDVLTALSDALPAIYPTARPSIEVSLLERMWDYSTRAEASVQKDQLQSRLARLMVLHDLWRGRAWGKQLAWQGGRIQVGAFLKDVAASRRSQLRLRAESLQDTAARNTNRALVEINALPPAPRVEALLLLAGQILS